MSLFRPDFSSPRCQDARWEEKASIKDAYPDLDGNELQTRVFADYLLDPSNPGQRLPLKAADNKEVLHRHTLNNRNYSAHREKL
eukprot:13580049-Alexandrium_andersonii.AAC.1